MDSRVMTFSGCCCSFLSSSPTSRWWICNVSLILDCKTSKNRNVSNFASKSIKTHPRSLPLNGMLCKTLGNIAPTAVWISNSVFPLPPNPQASITCECFKDLCWSKKDKPECKGSIFARAKTSAPCVYTRAYHIRERDARGSQSKRNFEIFRRPDCKKKKVCDSKIEHMRVRKERDITHPFRPLGETLTGRISRRSSPFIAVRILSRVFYIFIDFHAQHNK